jgi:hypothetical protein
MENIAKAIINTTLAIKGIEKSATIGTGQSAYKGVNDKEAKEIIRAAMAANGLCILPIGVNAKTTITQSVDNYGKPKQSVFTEVETKYLLLHTSGESIELSGYGHGVDTQDKSAGKATTYSLKYCLLYLFLIPTGKIDDTDATHSDDLPVIDKNHIAAPKTDKSQDLDADDIEDAKSKIITAKDIKDLEAKYNGLTDKQKTYAAVNALANDLIKEFKTKKNK